MDKQRYYVSVQGKSILLEQGAAAYELEIDATEEDVERLHEMMKELSEIDDATWFRSHIPGIPYHLDEENDAYDRQLRDLYAQLHSLGTRESKHVIENMHIL